MCYIYIVGQILPAACFSKQRFIGTQSLGESEFKYLIAPCGLSKFFILDKEIKQRCRDLFKVIRQISGKSR